jgi:hypothetical protein
MHPWRRLIDLRIVWLGIALIAIGFAISFWAISLFRLEGTELNPTSEMNKSLIIRDRIASREIQSIWGLSS